MSDRAWLRIQLSLFVVVVSAAASHLSAQACDRGLQPWQSSGGVVCLPTNMIAYIACLEKTTKGQLEVSQDSASSGASKFRVSAKGGGGGPLVHGGGAVTVDVRKSEQAVNLIKQKFDPMNVTNCFRGAFGSHPRPDTGSGALNKVPKSAPATDAGDLVRARSAADAKSENQGRTSVMFTAPDKDSTVEPVMVIKGKVTAFPKGMHLWLVTRREAGGPIHPKQRVKPNTDGSFEKQIWDHGDSGPLWVCALATEPSETTRFESWQRAGDLKRDWPAISEADSTEVLGCLDLKLNNLK